MENWIKRGIDIILEENGEKLQYAYSRWQDEKEYEDWKEYETYLTKLFSSPKCKVLKVTKRPFGVKCQIPKGIKIQFYVNAKFYGWKEIK